MSNNPDNSAGRYELREEEGLDADLDPALQNLVISSRSEGEDDFLLEKQIASGPVNVVAQLHDPEEKVDGLTVSQRIGQIVTGTVEIDAIEAVRSHWNVAGLEMARELYPTLDRSVYEIRAHREQIREALPAGSEPLDGSGVVVGVVDKGCDFFHPNFRTSDGKTRILFLWDQREGPLTSPPQGFTKGREFTAEMIDEALKLPRQEAYAKLDYEPRPNAHGTHVLDIAAGNGHGTRNPGVAPGADIIFVELTSGDAYGTDDCGDSCRLIEAVKYVFEKAAEVGRPAVVNISRNARAGPHDGSSPVDVAFEELLKTRDRAIVIGAGNFRPSKGHASGTLKPRQTRRLRWEIRPKDKTRNEMEIWYGGEHEFTLYLRSPGGQKFGPFPLGTLKRVWRDGKEVARVRHGCSYTDNGDNLITLIFSPSMEAGTWSLLLHSVSKYPAAFHAWIAGDPGAPSEFAAEDEDLSLTLGSYSCGRSTIVVSSYDPLKPHLIWPASSTGPTRDGRPKPDVSAPGVEICAASSLYDSKTDAPSGTSMAAPHVAGAVALLLQAGRELHLSAAEIRDAAISFARKGPPHGPGWNPRYGYGRFDAVSTLLACSQGTPQIIPET